MFTYDPATAAGQVRLLAADSVELYAKFSDTEIAAFLTLNASNVRLAAAMALEQKAALVTMVQGVTTFEGISVDGASVARVLMEQAAELRRQVYDGEESPEELPFDWAEMVVDTFSYRARLLSQILKQA